MFSPVLVHEYLSRSATEFPDKNAVICGGGRMSYRALERSSTRLSDALSSLGLKRGDRVIIFLDNSIEAVISMYGVLKAGAVFVILDSTMKAGKLGYIVRDSAASVLITDTGKADVVKEALSGVGRECTTLWVGDGGHLPEPLPGPRFSWAEVLREDRQIADPSLVHTAACIDQDLAALIYTSGSTGEPKGVMSTHHNVVSAARSIIQYLGNTPDDIIVSVLPLSFDYGLYQVIMAVMFGGTVVLEKAFLYPVKILERIEHERATGFPLVPTIAAFLLLKMKNLDRYDLSSLRYVTNTAAALPVEYIRKLALLLPKARLFSMYGLTECKRVSYLPPEELSRRPASVGKAIPNTEVFIVNESGDEALPGEVGELVIRGSHVMRGYWNAPELTAKTFRPGRLPGERLLFSGDLFRKDDAGFLYFVGRKDDMIKTRGERVSPREVENVLCGMEGILEAAVFGVPDEILGQAVVAYVVCPGEVRPQIREILKHSADRLQSFMVPKHVVFVDRLPKSSNGKIDKKTLKDEHEIKIAAGDIGRTTASAGPPSTRDDVSPSMLS